jgi:hypothetical protein
MPHAGETEKTVTFPSRQVPNPNPVDRAPFHAEIHRTIDSIIGVEGDKIIAGCALPYRLQIVDDTVFAKSTQMNAVLVGSKMVGLEDDLLDVKLPYFPQSDEIGFRIKQKHLAQD